jgi:hypothetical protein
MKTISYIVEKVSQVLALQLFDRKSWNYQIIVKQNLSNVSN